MYAHHVITQSFILTAAAALRVPAVTPQAVAALCHANAKRFYRLRYTDEAPAAGEVAAAAAAEDASGSEGEAGAADDGGAAPAAGAGAGADEAKASSAARPAEAAAAAAAPVVFACKLCRHTLFDASHIMPHLDAGLRPSRRQVEARAVLFVIDISTWCCHNLFIH